MSKAKLPLNEAIGLFENAIKFPSNADYHQKISQLSDSMKRSAAEWKKEDGYTLLHSVVLNWTDDIREWILQILLNNGAQPDVYYQDIGKHRHPLTPLTFAALVKKNPKLTKELLKKSAYPFDILNDALDFDNAHELISETLQTYPKVKDSVNRPSDELRSAPILKTARKRNQRAFMCLVTQGQADITICTHEDNNIFHEIALGIAQDNPDRNTLSDSDKSFIGTVLGQDNSTTLLFKKNKRRESPITLICDSGQDALLRYIIQSLQSLTEYKQSITKQFTSAQTLINLGNYHEDVKNELRKNLDQLSQELDEINLDKTKSSADDLIESVKKLSKLDSRVNDLLTLIMSLNDAKKPEDYVKASGEFINSCQHKMSSEETQSRYNALIGVIIGLAISAIIASTLLLVATGGIATFGAATILTFVTTNIAITAASGAVATIIIAACGYSGYNYGEGARWRANFFAVGSAVEEQVSSSEYVPLREYK